MGGVAIPQEMRGLTKIGVILKHGRIGPDHCAKPHPFGCTGSREHDIHRAQNALGIWPV